MPLLFFACWVPLHAFLLSTGLFKINFYFNSNKKREKILSGIQSECQIICIKMKPKLLLTEIATSRENHCKIKNDKCFCSVGTF